MLELKNITKDYVTGELVTHALKGVSLSFRSNEFVSILGASGCGKTTLLNIVGGLDRYTDGDLLIKGVSTKEYKDRDWDTYRNHSIGFIFQSYNLIMHQSIVRNVELALTIGGVSRKERHERAVEALTRVGLGEVVNKMPNQLSGGQMQRVAIARALVNNPEILLADEPTGALDSETSVQIMELLKEIASDRLVIMVTHNPELAMQYSTRIIRLNDGLVVDDSMPVSNEELAKENEQYAPVDTKKKKDKKASMSFATALSLSFKNLLAKKGRTILTGIAGSIGIIGIALILSLSDGFNTYIAQVESDALSEYPVSIYESEATTSAFVSLLAPAHTEDEKYPTDEKVGQSTVLGKMGDIISNRTTNNLKDFKAYLDSDEFEDEYGESINGIQYSYNLSFDSYTYNTTDSVADKVYPLEYTIGEPMFDNYISMMSSYLDSYTELLNNEGMLLNQYDVLKGRMPKNKNEVIVMVDEYNEIDDLTLLTLGLKDKSTIPAILTGQDTPWEGTFDDILGLKYYIVTQGDYYKPTELEEGTGVQLYKYIRYSQDDLNTMIPARGVEIEIVGIVRQKPSATSTFMQRGIGYMPELTQYLIGHNNEAEFIQATLNDTEHDILNGGEISESAYKQRLNSLQVCDKEQPSAIYIYPKSFSDKDNIVSMIDKYNARQTEKANKISFTDTVAVLMSSVTKIVNSVTYVLIAFVSISLVVSSIMIGIITYVSVIERTKEIGVLRSLGASKNDVSNVFNAETLMVGFVAGAIGVGVTLILIIPINLILNHLVGIANLAFLRWYWCAALIGISMLLTFIAGLIPSRFAAKRDPVIALRSGD